MKKEQGIHIARHLGMLLMACGVSVMTVFAQYRDHRGYKIDSLEQVLRELPQEEVETRARVYKSLMWAYSETDSDLSMKYARMLADISRKENYTLALANSLRVLGVQLYNKCDYDSALHYLHLSLEASARMEGDDRYDLYQMEDEQALTYGAIGNVYNMQGMNTLAIENYERVMRTAEKYQWNQTLATVYLNIAELYFGMENFPMAEEYVVRFDSLAHLTGDSLFIAKAHLEKGILYRTAYQDYDRALQHAQVAADYLLDNPEEGSWQLGCMHLLASIYLKTGKLAEAEKMIARQLAKAEEMESPYDIASALAQEAELHSRRKEWRKVMEAGARALTYNDLEPENTLGVYKLLGEASAQMGWGDEAMKYYDKAFELQTSWSNESHQSALAEQKVRYETERKELRIDSLEHEKRLMMVLAVSGGLLALLILLLLFYLNRMHRHQKRLLATQVALDSETAERQRIARDLHDGLGGMLSLVKVQMENDNPDKAMELLEDAHKELRNVAHHIMPAALMKHGLITALNDLVQIVPGAKLYVSGEDKRLDSCLEVILYRIAYELMNNALKHSHATNIDMQLIFHSDIVVLSVSDNGAGFEAGKHKNGEGMGLGNIRTHLAVYNGKMMIDSHPQRGTEVCVEIPIKRKKDVART